MMRLKSFETKEVREIAVLILGMGLINIFPIQEWKSVEENPCQTEEDVLAWDRQLCIDQWQ